MADSTNVFLGFDPDGGDKFGWSICRDHPRGMLQPPLKTGLLDATWRAVAAWAMIHHQEQNLPNWHDLYEWEKLESGRIVQLERDVRYWMPIPEDLYGAQVKPP